MRGRGLVAVPIRKRKEMQERWLNILIVLATEETPQKPGRVYFLATGDNTGVSSHKGRPALQAMERRGWVKQNFPGFGKPFVPASMLRAGEDSTYEITEEGRAKLADLGYDQRACKAVRKKWGR